MPYQMIISYLQRSANLAALTGAGGPLDGANISLRLLKAPLDVNTKTLRADLLAAEVTNVEFPGYALKTPVVWGTQFRDGGDNVYQTQGLKEWVATGNPPAPVSIAGVLWDDGTNWVYEQFASPQVIEAAGQAVRHVPQFGYGQ